MNRSKLIAALVVIAIAVAGFTIKFGSDPVRTVKLCTQVYYAHSDRVDERCDLR